jgi:hypothetical protein
MDVPIKYSGIKFRPERLSAMEAEPAQVSQRQHAWRRRNALIGGEAQGSVRG